MALLQWVLKWVTSLRRPRRLPLYEVLMRDHPMN